MLPQPSHLWTWVDHLNAYFFWRPVAYPIARLPVAPSSLGGAGDTGARYSVKWRFRVKDTYGYYVYVKDLAGNAQRVRGNARIRMRSGLKRGSIICAGDT
jgi:hypothetical protein